MERASALQNGLPSLPKPQIDENFRILVRLDHEPQFEGERTWRSKQDLLAEFGPWVTSLQKVWGNSASDLIFTFESTYASGVSKVLFTTSSVGAAAEKISLLVD